MMKTEEILTTLTAMFPDAHCELNHRNPFELAVAVVLSAQTTDAAVNKVTPQLFERYPDPASLAQAPLSELYVYLFSVSDCTATKLAVFRDWRGSW